MKKLLILCNLFVLSALHAEILSDILSDNKNRLFDYQFQSNSANSDMLENSWINPIMIQYRKNYSKQFTDRTIKTGSFIVGIDQPIFRSGGIYYAIKYAKAQRGANEAEIRLKKRETIIQAVKLLFELKRLKFERKKLALLIKNDDIDIRKKKESYRAGLVDSSFLDQAILKRNQDEIRMLELEKSFVALEQRFSLLSDKNPHSLKLPKLKRIAVSEYTKSNLELKRNRLRIRQKEYNVGITWAKYLPTVSLQARYTDEDLLPFFAGPGVEERYFSYGFSISMPIDINMFSDIEASKVAHLEAQTEAIEYEESLKAEYKLIKSKLDIIDKKIALAKKDEMLYQRLYKSTKNMELAGEKTSFDTSLMRHSLEIRRLDKQIYEIDKQIVLLEMYAKVENEF